MRCGPHFIHMPGYKSSESIRHPDILVLAYKHRNLDWVGLRANSSSFVFQKPIGRHRIKDWSTINSFDWFIVGQEPKTQLGSVRSGINFRRQRPTYFKTWERGWWRVNICPSWISNRGALASSWRELRKKKSQENYLSYIGLRIAGWCTAQLHFILKTEEFDRNSSSQKGQNSTHPEAGSCSD